MLGGGDEVSVGLESAGRRVIDEASHWRDRSRWLTCLVFFCVTAELRIDEPVIPQRAYKEGSSRIVHQGGKTASWVRS